ncbi:MAG: hypothetical protein Q4F29_14120, partial [Lachnospiraceae bacterium]|nr:hypothetical protein [Lachnospiraceae bacterium]
MGYFVYKPDKAGYINRFLTTKTFTKPQEFRKATLSGKVNEWLQKGFAIHENPCRKEFIAGRAAEVPPYMDISRYTMEEEIQVFGQNRKLSVYYPFGNQGVDFSEFYPNPTYLRCYSFVYIFSDAEEPDAGFQVETCGGVTLWAEDELVTDFIPFTRNECKKTEVSIHLRAGLNKVTVCLDDLAERDTDYYFRLRYLGTGSLKLYLPVPDDTAVEDMGRIEQAMEDMYFEKETYISEPVILHLNNPLERELDLTVSYKPVADKIWHGERLQVTKAYRMKKGESEIRLFDADDVIPGFYYFQVSAGVSPAGAGSAGVSSADAGGVTASRKIAVQVFHRSLMEKRESTIQERKWEALRYLVDVEVENVYKAAALLWTAEGQSAERAAAWEKAERIILEELNGIRARKDCSDFHLIVVLQIWKRFHEKLSAKVQEAIKETILNFRYWIDEPGNDVMWFFSENHALLFHICQYYGGKFFEEEYFSSSGLDGKAQSAKAERLLDGWFEDFFREYITEWNSNAYIPVDVLGLCGLYNLSEKGDKRNQAAEKALNMIFRDLAVNEHKGTIMTSFGRSYEKESKGNYTAGTTSLLYIAYNLGYLNRAALAYISFALGDYEPPAEYRKYTALKPGQELIYEKTQGYRSHVNLYLYKNSQVQLSTAVLFHPYCAGYQEHIMQATLDAGAQMYVTHPGEVQPYGNGRPNYWAGNGSLPLAVQYRNLGILSYRIPENHPVSYTHAYVPLMEFEDYLGTAHTAAAKKGGGYIGVRSLNPIVMQKKGPCRNRELISEGRENVWLIKVGTTEEYCSLEDFVKSLEEISVRWKSRECLEVRDSDLGVLEASEQGLTADGKP